MYACKIHLIISLYFNFLQRREFLVNMNSTNHGNPHVVSEEIVTTAESEITGLFFYPCDT